MSLSPNSFDNSLERQIEEARRRAELFSKSLLDAREQESLALKILESERFQWSHSFEEKSVMIDQLERELSSTVDALNAEREGSRDVVLNRSVDSWPAEYKSVNDSFENERNFSQQRPIIGHQIMGRHFVEATNMQHPEIVSFQTEKHQLLQRIKYLELEVEKLKEERVLLQKACRDADGKLQFRMSQVLEYEQEKERMKQIEVRLKGDIDALQSRLNVTSAELDTASKSLVEKRVDQDRLRQVNQEVSELKLRNEESARREIELSQKVEDLQRRLDAAETQSSTRVVEANSNANQLKTRIFEMERVIQEWRERAETAEIEVIHRERSQKKLQKELQLLTDKHRGSTNSVNARMSSTRTRRSDIDSVVEANREELHSKSPSRHHNPYSSEENSRAGSPVGRRDRDHGDRMNELLVRNRNADEGESASSERMARDNWNVVVESSTTESGRRDRDGEFHSTAAVSASFPPPASSYSSPTPVPPPPPPKLPITTASSSAGQSTHPSTRRTPSPSQPKKSKRDSSPVHHPETLSHQESIKVVSKRPPLKSSAQQSTAKLAVKNATPKAHTVSRHSTSSRTSTSELQRRNSGTIGALVGSTQKHTRSQSPAQVGPRKLSSTSSTGSVTQLKRAHHAAPVIGKKHIDRHEGNTGELVGQGTSKKSIKVVVPAHNSPTNSLKSGDNSNLAFKVPLVDINTRLGKDLSQFSGSSIASGSVSSVDELVTSQRMIDGIVEKYDNRVGNNYGNQDSNDLMQEDVWGDSHGNEFLDDNGRGASHHGSNSIGIAERVRSKHVNRDAYYGLQEGKDSMGFEPKRSYIIDDDDVSLGSNSYVSDDGEGFVRQRNSDLKPKRSVKSKRTKAPATTVAGGTDVHKFGTPVAVSKRRGSSASQSEHRFERSNSAPPSSSARRSKGSAQQETPGRINLRSTTKNHQMMSTPTSLRQQSAQQQPRVLRHSPSTTKLPTVSSIARASKSAR